MLETTTIHYVGNPTIPVDMTVAEYRRSRPARPSTWHRIKRLGRG
jgi:hypothetical protein